MGLYGRSTDLRYTYDDSKGEWLCSNPLLRCAWSSHWLRLLLCCAPAPSSTKSARDARCSKPSRSNGFAGAAGRTNADAHDKAPGYRQFLAGLPAADAERLEKARQALQSGGAAFSTTFVTRSGGRLYRRRAARSERRRRAVASRCFGCGNGPEGAPRSRRFAPDARRHSAAGVAARPRPHPRRLQPSLCERPRHDRRSGCRGGPGTGFRRPPRRTPARRHRRLAPAGRDRRGAVLDGRHNRFCL